MKNKKENLKEICYWKDYTNENPNCDFYCLKCNGKPEENCGDHREN